MTVSNSPQVMALRVDLGGVGGDADVVDEAAVAGGLEAGEGAVLVHDGVPRLGGRDIVELVEGDALPPERAERAVDVVLGAVGGAAEGLAGEAEVGGRLRLAEGRPMSISLPAYSRAVSMKVMPASMAARGCRRPRARWGCPSRRGRARGP